MMRNPNEWNQKLFHKHENRLSHHSKLQKNVSEASAGHEKNSIGMLIDLNLSVMII